jgi:hypothetical protein
MALAVVESSLKYRPYEFEKLTLNTHDLGKGHCLVGSLTGVVAS